MGNQDLWHLGRDGGGVDGDVLDLAERHGISHLDTAAGYGDSEHRIGSALAADSPLWIVTKLPPNLLDGQPPAAAAICVPRETGGGA